MTKPKKTLELKFERDIPVPPRVAYAAWLDPKVPGTPWHDGDELILNQNSKSKVSPEPRERKNYTIS